MTWLSIMTLNWCCPRKATDWKGICVSSDVSPSLLACMHHLRMHWQEVKSSDLKPSGKHLAPLTDEEKWVSHVIFLFEMMFFPRIFLETWWGHRLVFFVLMTMMQWWMKFHHCLLRGWWHRSVDSREDDPNVFNAWSWLRCGALICKHEQKTMSQDKAKSELTWLMSHQRKWIWKNDKFECPG